MKIKCYQTIFFILDMTWIHRWNRDPIWVMLHQKYCKNFWRVSDLKTPNTPRPPKWSSTAPSCSWREDREVKTQIPVYKHLPNLPVPPPTQANHTQHSWCLGQYPNTHLGNYKVYIFDTDQSNVGRVREQPRGRTNWTSLPRHRCFHFLVVGLASFGLLLQCFFVRVWFIY